MGNINKARNDTHVSLRRKKNLSLREKKNKNITNMKLLAILFVAEVILIASCETSKKVKEEKSEAEKVAKKSSLKERLQDIAKKAKRAKSYYSTSGWWNRRTTSYPYYDRTYD